MKNRTAALTGDAAQYFFLLSALTDVIETLPQAAQLHLVEGLRQKAANTGDEFREALTTLADAMELQAKKEPGHE